MSGEVIARRTVALMDVVEHELARFEDRDWASDGALGAADALADAEYGNKLLRTIGEEIGAVDSYNRTTALASSARRVTAAMHRIVRDSSSVVGSGNPLLSQFYGDAVLEDAADAQIAYKLIDSLFDEVIEDASSSLEVADQRLEAIGQFERDNSVADEDGTVWFPAVSGRIGITWATLTAEPSARNWAMEFATDIAQVAVNLEGVASEEELAGLRRPISGRVISSTVSSIILAQGNGPLENWHVAFFEDALTGCYAVTEQERSDCDQEDLADYEADCSDALKHLLDKARDFAAGITAYAALASALGQTASHSA